MPLHPGIRRLLALARGPAAVYLWASVVSSGAGLVLIPIYTRRLSLAEYGDYVLALTLIAVLPTVLTLGMTSALARFFFDTPDREEGRRRVGGVARAMILLAVGLALPIEGLVLALGQPDGLWGRWELSCILWAGVGGALAQIPSVYLRAAQRPYPAAALQLVQFFSVVGGGVVLVVLLGRGLRGAIEAYALAYVVNGLIAAVFVVLALPGRPSRTLFGEAMALALPFVPHFLANQAHVVSDRWTFKAYGFENSLGGYSLASQLVLPASVVVGAWNDAESPRIGEAYRDGGMPGLRSTYRGALKSYGLAAAIPVGGLLLLLPLLPYALGDSFVAFLKWVPVLGLGVIVETFYYPNANVLFFAGRVRSIPLVTIASATTNVVLNVVLIPLVGLPGAVVARLAAGSVRSVAIGWVAARVLAEGRGP